VKTWRLAGVLLLAACTTQQQPVAAAIPTVAAVTLPTEGLWLALDADTEHLSPVGFAPTVPWIPFSRVVADGAVVAPGDELAALSEEVLRSWNARDSFSIARDAQDRRLNLLRGEGDIAGLISRIRQLKARREVVAAQLKDADHIDPDEVRIAELGLADAQAQYAAARLRCDRLEGLAASGSPVSGSELARAREEVVRTRSGLAAPAVTLELARLPAAGSTVRRLQLALADLDAQLGTSDDEGLAAELRTAEERRRRRLSDDGRSDRRQRDFDKRAALLADPTIRSTVAGTVLLRDENTRVGSRVGGGIACLFVLAPDGLAAQVQVPERLRPLVTASARISLLPPMSQTGHITGRVTSIASSPDEDRDQRRVFIATVLLDAVPQDLRPGMSLSCRLAVELPSRAVLIPSYVVPDHENPEVVTEDGSPRRLEGHPVGGWFVALSGLAVGDRIRIPDGTPGPGRVRASALVESDAFVPVRLSSWNWEVVDVLPEGTMVRAGQRIAGLSKNEFWRPVDQVRSDAEVNMLQARLDLQIAQLSAADQRAAAQAALIRAGIERERAKLETWVVRRSYDAVAEARVAASLETAVVSRDRALRELAAAEEERKAGGISEVQLRERQIAVERAGLTLDDARLAAAASELASDWIDLRRLDDWVQWTADDEVAKSTQAAIAGEAYRAALASALARFEGTRRWVQGELASIADEVVTAPAEGMLVYTRGSGPTARPGVRLGTQEPFRIAIGAGRRATFELPAREFGRIAIGDVVRLRSPGVSGEIQGRVTLVANAFLPPQGFADEITLGRTVGPEERVFRVTVSFQPPEGDQTKLPPGSTVHVDL
jgi:hypothetical protein